MSRVVRGREQPITVVVADDHPLMRDAVVRSLALDDGLRVVAQADRGDQAIAMIRAELPKVAILDLDLGDMSALDVLRLLREEGSSTRVLVLSAHTESALVHSALAEGASGYLSKATAPEELARAVRRIAASEMVVEPRLHDSVFAEVRQRGPGTRASPNLSDRELEVLRLSASGESERAIAECLHVSQSSVKTYLRRIYDKLGARDKASAVAAGLRNGLIQ
jgi:two-component system nitrate/nitrite response regulator NarL